MTNNKITDKKFRLTDKGDFAITFTDMVNVPAVNKDVSVAVTFLCKGNNHYHSIGTFHMTWGILLKDVRPWIKANCDKPWGHIDLYDIHTYIEVEDGNLKIGTLGEEPGVFNNPAVIIPKGARRFNSIISIIWDNADCQYKAGSSDKFLKSDKDIISQKPYYGGYWKCREDVIRTFEPIPKSRLNVMASSKDTKSRVGVILCKMINSISNATKFGNVNFLFSYKGNRDMFVLFTIGNNSAEDITYHYIDMGPGMLGSTFEAGEAYDRMQLSIVLGTIDNIEEREYYTKLCEFLQEV